MEEFESNSALDDGVGGHPGLADAANEAVPPARLPQKVQSFFDALRDGLNGYEARCPERDHFILEEKPSDATLRGESH